MKREPNYASTFIGIDLAWRSRNAKRSLLSYLKPDVVSECIKRCANKTTAAENDQVQEGKGRAAVERFENLAEQAYTVD